MIPIGYSKPLHKIFRFTGFYVPKRNEDPQGDGMPYPDKT